MAESKGACSDPHEMLVSVGATETRPRLPRTPLLIPMAESSPNDLVQALMRADPLQILAAAAIRTSDGNSFAPPLALGELTTQAIPTTITGLPCPSSAQTNVPLQRSASVLAAADKAQKNMMDNAEKQATDAALEKERKLKCLDFERDQVQRPDESTMLTETPLKNVIDVSTVKLLEDGDMVDVKRDFTTGMCREGGRAKVLSVHGAGGNTTATVRYALTNTTERGVPLRDLTRVFGQNQALGVNDNTRARSGTTRPGIDRNIRPQRQVLAPFEERMISAFERQGRQPKGWLRAQYAHLYVGIANPGSRGTGRYPSEDHIKQIKCDYAQLEMWRRCK